MASPAQSVATPGTGSDDEQGYSTTLHDLMGSPDRATFSNDTSTDRSDVNSSVGSSQRLRRSVDLEEAPSSTDAFTANSSNLRLYVTGSQSHSSGSSAQDVQAFKSYINNVDYVKNQTHFLSENPHQAPRLRAPEANKEDHQLLETNLIAGYTLVAQFEPEVARTILFYRAVDTATNAAVLLRISPLVDRSSSILRVLNEWFILLGKNPPRQHRLWTNDEAENEYVAAHSCPRIGPGSRALFEPVTLPPDVPGIMYPKDVVSMATSKELGGARRMALVYEDHQYQSLKEYHSISSSGGSGGDAFDPTLDFASRTGVSLSSVAASGGTWHSGRLGRLAFEDMCNRVRLTPQLPLKIVEVLGDIISVAKTLRTVHELGIVHNGLTTECLFRRDDGTVEISGWDFCFTIQPEDCAQGYRKRNLTNLMAILPYLSPEATGDANKRASYKSDFYSLGIILYELCVGVLPFEAPDVASVIRMHLSQKPLAPVLLAPSWITHRLSRLVMKLLEKNDTQRPADALEIIHELTRVRNEYVDEIRAKGGEAFDRFVAENEAISRYFVSEPPSRENSVPPVFVLPEAIYGRNEEYRKIFVTADCLTEGENLVLISGPAGYGKLVLLGDFRAASVSKTNFYCTWKFSRSSANKSIYTVFIAAISLIVKQILKQSQATIDKWRHLFITKIPLDLGVLFYLVPDLGVLLGPKYTTLHARNFGDSATDVSSEEVEAVDSSDEQAEATNPQPLAHHYRNFGLELKYRYIIKEFLALVATDGLTIFLDDIQWSTPGEISLFAEVVKHVNLQEAEGCLKIVATMDLEVSVKFEGMDNEVQNSNQQEQSDKSQLSQQENSQETTQETTFKEDPGRKKSGQGDDLSSTHSGLGASHTDSDKLSSSTIAELFKASGAKVFEFSLGEITLGLFSHFLQSAMVIDSPFSSGSEVASLSRDESTSLLSMYGGGVTDGGAMAKCPMGGDEKVHLLAELLHKRLRGNVLFAKYVLKTAYMAGDIHYRASRTGHRWDYSITAFDSVRCDRVITNYLALSLDSRALTLMKYAAVITDGQTFRLLDLLLVSNLRLGDVYRTLYRCLETGVLSPGGPFYKLPFHVMSDSNFPVELTDQELWRLASDTTYRFDHDVIQAAILQHLVDNNELEEYHRLCGLRFHKKLRKEPNSSISNYLVMANHIAKSWQVARPEERATYHRVLIKAGKLAMSTYNPSSSLVYFQAADRFISDHNVKHKLRNRMTMCQVQYYLNNFETCLRMIEELEKQYGLDKTRFVIFRVRSLIKLGRRMEALDVSLECLRTLGVDVSEEVTLTKPVALNQAKAKGNKGSLQSGNAGTKSSGTQGANMSPTPANVAGSGTAVKRLMAQIPHSSADIRALKHLPATSDAKVLVIYQILSELLPLTFATGNHKLRYNLVLQAVDLMLHSGVLPFCAVPLLFLANIFASEYTEAGFVRAQEYSLLALYWADKNEKNSVVYSQAVYELFVGSLASYLQPVADVLQYYETFHSSLSVYSRLQTIRLDSSTNAAKLHLLLLDGARFNTLFPRWAQNRFEIKDTSSWNQVYLAGLRLMQGLVNLEEYEAIVENVESNMATEFVVLTCRLFYFAVKNRSEEAVQIIDDVMERHIPYNPITILHAEFYFAAGVVLATAVGALVNKNRTKLLADIVGKFALFAQFSPATFLGKHLLLRALQEARQGTASSLEILDAFEDAIETARGYGSWHDVAWTTYLCAMWLLLTGAGARRTGEYARAAHAAFVNLDSLLLALVVELRLGTHLKEYNWAGLEALEDPSAKPLGLVLGKIFTGKNEGRRRPRPKRTQGNYRTNLYQLALNVLAVDSHEQLEDVVPEGGVSSLHGSGSGSFPGAPPRVPSTPPARVGLRETVNASLTIAECTTEDEIVLRLLESTVVYSRADSGAVVLNSKGDVCVRAIGSASSIITLNNEPLSLRGDLCPLSLISYVLYHGRTVNKDEDRIFFAGQFSHDEYYRASKCDASICLPLKNSEGIFGAVYLERFDAEGATSYFSREITDLLTLLCSQATVALAKASLYLKMAIAKRAAENATAEKASFLANMSHEIRTPFNSLLSCSLFLLDTELNNTQKEYVETIKTQAMLTLNIIDGILAFSKLEHGSFTLESAPFSLNDCIESAVQIVGEQALSSDIDLAFFNRCPNIDTITGDVTRFRQILINLLGNAVKFTSRGHIMVTLVLIHVQGDRHEFEICVEDTGVGIPQLSQSKVFGAFSQVDASSRRSYGGLGLGLAISKKLADLMGGTLTFDSDEGVGTRFYLTLKAQATVKERCERVRREKEEKDRERREERKKKAKEHSGASEKKEDKTENSSELEQAPTPLPAKSSHPSRPKIDPVSTGKHHSASNQVTKPYRSSPSVLVVDRHKYGLLALQETLQQYGLQVETRPDFGAVDKTINTYRAVFLDLPAFEQMKRRHNITRLHCSIVLIGQFGKVLPPEVDLGTILVMMWPFQRAKLESLLMGISEPESPATVALLLSKLDVAQNLAEEFPLRILLAEDNLINIKVALQHLKKLGYRADAARDGQEAVEKCISHAENGTPYQVVLMDIQMPRKDGLAATVEIHSWFRQKGLEAQQPQIVALTANVAGEDKQRLIESGMVDFISKPILPEQLARVLRGLGEKIQKEQE